ncbi:MAG: hypothetical protein IJ659_07100 [Alloprevotella sp.]|nr:hypothetical protein [Alloprevotella sp.]
MSMTKYGKKLRQILSCGCLVLTFGMNACTVPDYDDDVKPYGTDITDVPGAFQLLVEMHDADGNDLLDFRRDDNVLEGLTVSFLGRTYAIADTVVSALAAPMAELTEEPEPEEGYALHLEGYRDVPFRLAFSAIPGTKLLDKEPFEIRFGDGTHETVLVSNRWNGRRLFRSFVFHNRTLDYPLFEIVR